MKTGKLQACILVAFFLAAVFLPCFSPAISFTAETSSRDNTNLSYPKPCTEASIEAENPLEGELGASGGSIQVMAEVLPDDPSYIEVEKIINGLTAEQLDTLKESLQITVSSGGSTYTLRYGTSTGAITWIGSGNRWKWKITGVSGGSYTVSETGCQPGEIGLPQGSTLTTTGTGNIDITSSNVNLDLDIHTTCNHIDWPVYDGKLFAGSLTGKGVVVISHKPISARFRTELENALIRGSWKAPVYYYDLESFEGDGSFQIDIVAGSSTRHMTYYPNRTYEGESTPGVVEFTATSDWKQVAEVIYSTAEQQIGDIQIVNNYRQITGFTVNKAWDDADNQDGIRPANITVKLLADGADTGNRLTLYAGSGWHGSFSNLDRLNNGEIIDYSIEEVGVPGYTASIAGNAEEGFTITNSHTPETIDIEGTKTWNDAEAGEDKRPQSITIRLYADGIELTDRAKVVSAEDNWEWSWKGLPKYSKGREIVYSLHEDLVENYEAHYSGFNIENEYVVPKTDVVISKKVSGVLGDRNKVFRFSVTSTEPISANNGYVLSADGKTATFSLKHGLSVVLKDVPIGAELTISESNADSYTVMISADNKAVNGSVTVAENMTILVNNQKEIIPDTGLWMDSQPYVLLLLLIAASLFIQRRRQRLSR